MYELIEKLAVIDDTLRPEHNAKDTLKGIMKSSVFTAFIGFNSHGTLAFHC